MLCVPWDAGVFFTAQDGVHEGVAFREGREKASVARDLTIAQLGNDIFGALLEADITSGTIHERTGREVMPESVALAMNVSPGWR